MKNKNIFPYLAYLALRYRLIHGGLKNRLRAYLAAAGFTVDVKVDGLVFNCHFGDNRTEQLLAERKSPEDENLNMVVERLPKEGVFVDIGANCGLFSLYAARAVGDKGTVVAVEPLPNMRERIAVNTALNAVDNVHVMPYAVGDEEGPLTLHVVPYQMGQSSLVAVADAVPVHVQVKRLQALVDEAGVDRIDVLKIDVEGYEDRALLPFFETAAQGLWPRWVFMETEHQPHWKRDCVEALTALGYSVAWRSKTDILLQLH